MAKAIYCIKIFILRNQFDLQQQKEKPITSICELIAMLYINVWFKAQLL